MHCWPARSAKLSPGVAADRPRRLQQPAGMGKCCPLIPTSGRNYSRGAALMSVPWPCVHRAPSTCGQVFWLTQSAAMNLTFVALLEARRRGITVQLSVDEQGTSLVVRASTGTV
jgi:hypothetical protein